MTIVMIGNAKGGTGKTSAAVSIAAEAAHRGLRTLLVDLDVQANASRWLSGSTGDGGLGLQRFVMDGDPLRPIATSTPQLDLVCAGPRTLTLARELQERLTLMIVQVLMQAGAEFRAAVEGYDLVVIDTPPSRQSATLTNWALAASDALLIPCMLDPNSTAAAIEMLGQVRKLSDHGVRVANPVGVLLVNCSPNATRLKAAASERLTDGRGGASLFPMAVSSRLAPVAYAQARNATPRQLLDAAPSASERLAGLRSGGEVDPVDRASAAAVVDDYAAVTTELLRRMQPVAAVDPVTSAMLRPPAAATVAPAATAVPAAAAPPPAAWPPPVVPTHA